MRKIISSLSIMITFGIAAFFGYTTASLPNITAQPGTKITSSTTPPATQQNILLIQLDETIASKPILQAVWIAAYFKSTNQTVLTFTQLYPTNQATRLSNFDTIFSLTPDGSPSKQFFRAISAAKIKWSGYLLIDKTGSLQVENWLRDQGVPIFTQANTTPQIFLETVCSYLSSRAASPSSSNAKFDWNQFDAHFQTDLALDTLLAGWDGLFDDTRPIRCEVVED